MTTNTPEGLVVVGVDTHKAQHWACALDERGRELRVLAIPPSRKGYRQLLSWAGAYGGTVIFGVEGTGSYGKGLTRYLVEQGVHVVEVDRPARRARGQRRRDGKTDILDARRAAEDVLAGRACGAAKTGSGPAEMMRTILVVRTGAVKTRTKAMNQLKALLVTAPDDLRAKLGGLTALKLAQTCDRFRVGDLTTTAEATRYAMKAAARRWLELDAEVRRHTEKLGQLAEQAAPDALKLKGIGPVTLAELLSAFGDNGERIGSEAAFAKICGVCPIPASSGATERHRLNRGGNRAANAALYRIVINRLRWHAPTKAYVLRRKGEGLTKRETIRCLKRYVAREVFHCLASSLMPTAHPGAQVKACHGGTPRARHAQQEGKPPERRLTPSAIRVWSLPGTSTDTPPYQVANPT